MGVLVGTVKINAEAEQRSAIASRITTMPNDNAGS